MNPAKFRNSVETTDYDARLARAVSTAVKIARSFEDLCHCVAGAAPQDVLQYVARSDFERLRTVDSKPVPSLLDGRIPEPHPIDYDWRFDRATVDFLESTTRQFENILCVGTPTIFDSIARSGRRAALIDRNPFLAKALSETALTKLFFGEVENAELQPTAYDAAILDPPWYPSTYHLWLRKVIPALRPGGSVFLILFKGLTRPSASHELRLLLEQLDRAGEVSILPKAATYITPKFELEALQRQNLPVLRGWRQGDILQLNLSPTITTWPGSSALPSNRRWRRFLIADQVVATVVRDGDDGPIVHRGLEGPGPSFELASVSDRDTRRQSADIWTSRNRGARVTGIERVAAMLAMAAEAPRDQNCPKLALSQSDHKSFRRLLSDVGLDNGVVLDA